MIVDLFAGPGGWSEGLRSLGACDVGIETNLAACKTRTTAGHITIRADVTQMNVDRFAGHVEGLIASPPCTDFSIAGNRAGYLGETGKLMREVPRWVEATRPRWIACEQVPPARAIYEQFADEFAEKYGYKCWVGEVNAADLGVPQTRKRVFLLASLDFVPMPSPPTHARDPQPNLFGEQLLPWVSMAEALGWTDNERRLGFPRIDDIGDSPDGYRERDWRDAGEPSFALTEKARSWVIAVNTGRDWKPGGTRDDAQTIPATEPAPAIDGKGRWHAQWVHERPSTTVCADRRIGTPGHRDRAGGERQFKGDAIRLGITEALILQGFRPDYPVCGNNTAQFTQIGNAVCPPVAAALLRQFIERPAR